MRAFEQSCRASVDVVKSCSIEKQSYVDSDSAMSDLTSNASARSALIHAIWRRRLRISFHQIRIRAHLGFDMFDGWRGDNGNEKWRRFRQRDLAQGVSTGRNSNFNFPREMVVVVVVISHKPPTSFA